MVMFATMMSAKNDAGARVGGFGGQEAT